MRAERCGSIQSLETIFLDGLIRNTRDKPLLRDFTNMSTHTLIARFTASFKHRKPNRNDSDASTQQTNGAQDRRHTDSTGFMEHSNSDYLCLAAGEFGVL